MNKISLDILKRICQDTCSDSDIIGVGVAGSFTRNDYTETSDIDLVLNIKQNEITDQVLEIASRIRNILDNQFRKKCDFILCQDIEQGMQGKISCDMEGYQQLKHDLVWVWGNSYEL